MPLKQNDVISATHFARSRSSSSNMMDPPSISTTPDRSSSGGYHKSKHRERIHPAAAAAYAHDLAIAEPMEEGRLSRSSHASTSSRHSHNASMYLPGDRVIFAESPGAPGVPIVYRTPDERSANPDRLNLDRRRLAVCPVLEGEEQLRLLNYQHNSIREISHLSTLKRLIFLDLYDNQIEEISGLSNLRSLRVLMLGKNRISVIENLGHLSKLDVLDLHGNQIRKIENLSHLQELRVLNLAGNLIEHVTHLSGMEALTELNLRRNKIRTVRDVDNLRCIQRLFLSFNEITCFEDIGCLADCHSLTEVSLDGNPFQQDPSYKKTVIRNMQQLRQFDMKRISDEEKRTAAMMARKEDDKKRQESKLQMVKTSKKAVVGNIQKQLEGQHQNQLRHKLDTKFRLSKKNLYAECEDHDRRRLAIHNAKRQWEVMQGSQMGRASRVLKNAMPELYASHVTSVSNSDVGMEEDDNTISSRSSSRMSRPTSAKSVTSERDVTSRTTSRNNSASSRSTVVDPVLIQADLAPASSLNHLAELEGDTLTLYGSGALDAFDKSWGIQAAGAVTIVIFKFIEFDEVSRHLHKIRVRFPNVHTLIFTSTNIQSLQQINALSALRRLDNLTIEPEGNPITQYQLWKAYVLFRLAHFSLKKINDVEVGASDIVNAEKVFGTLSHMTTSQLPQSRLLALLGDSKRKHLLDDKKKPSSSEGRLTDRGTESVGRAGLVYAPPHDTQTHAKSQESKSNKEFVKNYVKELASTAIDCDRKQATLQKLWPQLLYELVHSAVLDMWDSQAYAKKYLEELEKS